MPLETHIIRDGKEVPWFWDYEGLHVLAGFIVEEFDDGAHKLETYMQKITVETSSTGLKYYTYPGAMTAYGYGWTQLPEKPADLFWSPLGAPPFFCAPSFEFLLGHVLEEEEGDRRYEIKPLDTFYNGRVPSNKYRETTDAGG